MSTVSAGIARPRVHIAVDVTGSYEKPATGYSPTFAPRTRRSSRSTTTARSNLIETVSRSVHGSARGAATVETTNPGAAPDAAAGATAARNAGDQEEPATASCATRGVSSVWKRATATCSPAVPYATTFPSGCRTSPTNASALVQ